MDNLSYLFVAYTVIFAVIFGYVLFIWRRQVALEAELRAMEARMRALDEAAGAARAAESRAGS
ncbi:MAG TPA: CcmD family protein [Candidatus Binataceae bacterium]|nr:CcmD family protein [Candidatus Binataceae bacterium]